MSLIARNSVSWCFFAPPAVSSIGGLWLVAHILEKLVAAKTDGEEMNEAEVWWDNMLPSGSSEGDSRAAGDGTEGAEIIKDSEF